MSSIDDATQSLVTFIRNTASDLYRIVPWRDEVCRQRQIPIDRTFTCARDACFDPASEILRAAAGAKRLLHSVDNAAKRKQTRRSRPQFIGMERATNDGIRAIGPDEDVTVGIEAVLELQTD